MVTLQEVKQYLRIDFEEEDPLLISLLATAKQQVMSVGRMDEAQLSEHEDTARTAILYAVSYLYENRNTADFSKLNLSLRSLLFAQREGGRLMEIGTLNQRITLLEQRVKVDAIGNHCNRWEEAFSCWARVTLKSSVENADTGVTKEVQTLDFYIRQQRQWMPSTSANRILFQGVVYDITSVTPDFIRKDYLKLTATARKAGEANGNS